MLVSKFAIEIGRLRKEPVVDGLSKKACVTTLPIGPVTVRWMTEGAACRFFYRSHPLLPQAVLTSNSTLEIHRLTFYQISHQTVQTVVPISN